MPSFSIATLSLLFAVFLILCYRTFKPHRKNPLPPGPKKLPILGNLLQVLRWKGEHRWITYYNLSRQYGDIVHLDVLGDITVVLNSQKAINEVLERRSANYSDRPPMYMTDLSGWDWNFAHMEYSDWWRLHRKTFHQYFQPRAVPEFYDIQRTAAKRFLQNIATSPLDYYKHIKYFAASVILKVIYDYNLQPTNDPYLKLAHDAVQGIIQTGNHGTFLVDYFPSLRFIPSWFPGTQWKRKASAWAKLAYELRDRPWEWFKQSLDNNANTSCFAAKTLERFSSVIKQDPAIEEMIKNCAGISYMAGSDTTVSAIASFVLAMALHPEVQIKAQKEIDSLVGNNRLPDFDDKERLPYIDAILAEVLRWHPVTPLAVPHRNLKDDVFEGYFIPAGSTIVGNAWAVLHDEATYGPEPMKFNPDRFMEKELVHPTAFCFGYARRICPGRYMALNSIWLIMVYLLSTYEIKKKVDADGNEIEPIIEYNDGLISHPSEFSCQFIPRSSQSARLFGGTV